MSVSWPPWKKLLCALCSCTCWHSAIAVAQVCEHQWQPQTNAGANDFATLSTNQGVHLYMAGALGPPGSTQQCVARWSGEEWENVGLAGYVQVPANQGVVYTLGPSSTSGNGCLYAGGYFGSMGGVDAISLASWDGLAWSRVEGDLAYKSFPAPIVRTMLMWDDGNGLDLYVGGFLTSAAGVPVSGIAKWDGESWSSLGSGVSGYDSGVLALATYDGGGGDALYVGGSFWFAGGTFSQAIAKWDGHAWHSVGGGTIPNFEAIHVLALSVFDAGLGPELYVAGCFEAVGSPVPVPNTRRIARWNGTSWLSAGSNTTTQCIGGLAVFDDGVRGPALYATGGTQFTSIGGARVQGIARYDGTSWSSIEAPPPAHKTALYPFAVGSTPTLWVSGGFQFPGGPTASMAQYQYSCEPCYPDCDASGTLTIADFSCFQGKFAAGAPEADCNQNGALTIADFGCFQARFVAGCP